MEIDANQLLLLFLTSSISGALLSTLGLVGNGVIQERRERGRRRHEQSRDERLRQQANQRQAVEELQRLTGELLEAAVAKAEVMATGVEPSDEQYAAVRNAMVETINWTTRLEHEAFADRIIFWVALTMEEYSGQSMRGYGTKVWQDSTGVMLDARSIINTYLGHLWRDLHKDVDVVRVVPPDLDAETLARRLLEVRPDYTEAMVEKALRHIESKPMMPVVEERPQRLRLPWRARRPDDRGPVSS